MSEHENGGTVAYVYRDEDGTILGVSIDGIMQDFEVVTAGNYIFEGEFGDSEAGA